MTTTERPRLLIEEWLPIKELGIESQREGTPIPGQSPKLKTMHTWWARRPLVASSGVLLGSLLPPWSPELASGINDPRVASESAYRKWVLNLCGVLGDAVAAQHRIQRATAEGRTLGADAYGYPAAWKNTPNPSNLLLLREILVHQWGRMPRVLDPTAGGGSIPFQALRFGLEADANDLNSVAASILRLCIESLPTQGDVLRTGFLKWGAELRDRCSSELVNYYVETAPGTSVTYMYVRSVQCPRTGKLTPLAPNWWLSKKPNASAAVQLITEVDGRELDEVRFVIEEADSPSKLTPHDATVARGAGISVWDALPIDGDYIKGEAREGRMQSLLYAISERPRNGKRRYRGPTKDDLAAVRRADASVDVDLEDWQKNRVVPDEERYIGPADRSANYGIVRHIDLYSRRQLLAHATFVTQFRQLVPEVMEDLGETTGRPVLALISMIQGKALPYNSVLTTWNAAHAKRRSVFDTHSFAFKWTFIEMDGARELFSWAYDQVLDSLEGILDLLRPGTAPYVLAGETYRGSIDDLPAGFASSGSVTRGSAADLKCPDGRYDLVCIDPPYHDNVMYAELSDFFGVWEQHAIGLVWPDLVPGGLADVANEAVANVARFKDFGRRRGELANADYLAKMKAIFSEAHRVLQDDGVLTVMFTHKKAEAWDTLGSSLMEAGFEIGTSWPVHTESDQSLHQAKKNAAASTIMLVCRKRPAGSPEPRFFEDLVPDVKSTARHALELFERDGIGGVDLLLSTYGPVLSVISAAWPVYASEVDEGGNARLLRPEEALDVAREELIQARRRALVGRQVTFDPVTDFWLISWELFQAEEFPYDEARRLALAVGGQDPESLAAAGVLKKKSGSVVLQTPADRRRTVLRPVQDGEIDGLPLVDIMHGVMVIAEVDGLGAAKAAMDRLGLTEDSRFLALVQGSVNALPFGKKKGEFIRSEAATLHGLVTAYLPAVELPEEELPTELFPE